MKRLSTLTAITTFSSTLICIAIITLSTYGLVEDLLQKQIKNEKLQIMIAARQAIVLPLWNYDEQYIHEILNSLINEQIATVVSIKVTTKDGRHTYIETSKAFKNQNIDHLVQRKKLDSLQTSLTHKGTILGTIEIFFSTERFAQEFKSLGKIVFLIAIIMGFVLAGLMIHFLRKLIVNPLYEIASDARLVGLGNYNINFKDHYFGELNVVTNSFNETIKAIKLRDKKLQEQNFRLEELVEKRTQERDLEQRKSFQASRLALLGEMAGGIAHEINNPLTIIQLNSNYLELKLKKQNSLDLFYRVKTINNTCRRIANIVRSLKSFSKDGSKESSSYFLIEELVTDISSLCRNRSKDLGIDLKFFFEPGARMFGNFTEMGQVLINLINNSIDAVSILPTKWIEISFETLGDKTRITVTDSGEGISDAIADKMMEPFFTTKHIGKGTGLGLSISHGIIKNHSGEFFYNPKSKHTQFIIYLPFPIDKK